MKELKKELKNVSTKPPKHVTKSKCKERLAAFHKQLFELQNVFYADGRYGLLIVLQGMDTSGKDGSIRHVMTCMNPMGLHVKSFKKPTEEELKHDFLWRIYPHIPEKSMIQVFNRSYYEDIIMPPINDTLSEDMLKHRCSFINVLEQHLLQNDIHILKFYLHISKQEQEQRIEERLLKPHKRWKYSKEDVKAANKFDSYAEIYSNIIRECNAIPWNIIAADILIVGTPIWLGEKSSIAQKLIERLYGMSGQLNKKGQYSFYGKVGGCMITGNEDGVKHCAMGILYSLQHVGYSIPPQADCGWIGTVGPGPSYGDTEWNGEKLENPVGFDSDFTNRNTTFMTYNLLHLASLLKKQDGYPNYGNSREEWDDGTRWNFDNPEYR